MLSRTTVVLTLVVSLNLLFVGGVLGHGYMSDPVSRSGTNDFAVNNLPCGGDRYNTPGDVVKTYTAGQTVDMTWQPTIQHRGDVTYRICPTEPATEECFKANVLGTVANPGGNNPITGKVKIPENVQCERCTISWYWEGGNDIYSNCADVQILAVGDLATNGTSTTSTGMSKGGAVALAIFLTALVVLAAVGGVVFYLLKTGKLAFAGASSSNTDYSRLSTA